MPESVRTLSPILLSESGRVPWSHYAWGKVAMQPKMERSELGRSGQRRALSRLARPLGVFLAVGLVAALATPAVAAVAPVDISGPVTGGFGPGVAVAPASGFITGISVTVDAENLPTGAEAALWVDDGDFSEEVGSYAGDATIALCGNADSGGSPLVSFDPAVHCDGTDLRSTTFVATATSVGGVLSSPLSTRSGFGTFEWDDDNDGGTAPITSSAGIGIAQATCVPDVSPCRVLVQDVAATVFAGTATFTVVAPASMSISSITGQDPAAEAARAGNELVVTGAGWNPAFGLAAAMCDAADPLVCDPSSSTAGLAIDGGGNLTGSVPVDATNTPGLRVLSISQPSGGQLAFAPLMILGIRTISLDPTGGGGGTAVNVTGSGFDPLQAVTVGGSDGANPTSDVGSGVVDSTGNLTGSLVVNSSATVSIVVTEDDAPTTEGASAAFSFAIQSQTGQVVIDGSALTLTQAGGLIDMSPVAITGTDQSSVGAVQTVTINDLRGTLSGWAVTAVATDWVDILEPDPANPVLNHSIPAGNLTWVPSCLPAPGSTADPADVVAGLPSTLDPNIAATMCTAAPGGGGGVWEADALLVLAVPSSIAAGAYRATLTIVAA